MDDVSLAYDIDYTVLNRSISFWQAPTGKVRIYRETATSRLVEWNDGSVFKADDMTITDIQLLHLLEEYYDTIQLKTLMIDDKKQWDARKYPIVNVGKPVDETSAVNVAYMLENALCKHRDNKHWDGKGLQIKNIPKPTDAHDAVNKEYLETETLCLDHNDSNFHGKGKRLKNIANPHEPQDAVTLTYLEKYGDSHSFDAPMYDPNVTYEPPDMVIASDGNFYRCVKTSKGEDPVTSNKWVQMASVVCRTFEPDTNGDLMPKLLPRASQNWTLDDKGQIMPV